jgi:hypothetical protein
LNFERPFAEPHLRGQQKREFVGGSLRILAFKLLVSNGQSVHNKRDLLRLRHIFNRHFHAAHEDAAFQVDVKAVGHRHEFWRAWRRRKNFNHRRTRDYAVLVSDADRRRTRRQALGKAGVDLAAPCLDGGDIAAQDAGAVEIRPNVAYMSALGHALQPQAHGSLGSPRRYRALA